MSISTEEKSTGRCIWTPTPKQTEFLASSFQELLYGGAAGGGKSDALLIDALGLGQGAVLWSRYRAILFRRTFPELEELVDRSREIYPNVAPGAFYHKTDHEWIFPSGAKIIFGYMDNDDHRFKHQGQEYQWVGWDELTHWATPVCYKYLLGRLRSINPKIKCFTRAATNPGGAGHSWVKEHWNVQNDGKPTQFVHVDEINGEEARSSRQFIPAKLDDNPYLSSSGYREMLLKLPERERKKLLEGRWDVLEGQFFANWDPVHHIVDPFPIPPAWPRWRALDWGKSRPYSVGWYAMDPDGVIYRYRELYGWGGEANLGTHESPKTVGERILEIEKEEAGHGIVFRNNPADHNCWYSRGEEVTIIELFGNKGPGVTWQPSKAGPGSRINGWNVCNERLEQGTFKVFSNCLHFIRTVPVLQVDDKKPEDLDTHMEDHVADEWRYSLVSRHRFETEERDKPKPLYMSFDYIIEMDEEDTPTRSPYRL